MSARPAAPEGATAAAEGAGALESAPALLSYGDDFTGATDALATAARNGLRSLLFLAVPDEVRLARAGALDWIGIAGAARSMAPAEMREELAPVAALARRLAPRVLHYKTCSTFDSAPEVGSIGEAVRALREAAGPGPVAIVGGQPNLGRYCLFGHLFAAAGRDGEVFRLDRHPTMSRHPVTPMRESDLRRHLAAQGLADIALVPWTAYAQGDAALARHAADADAAAVLWDVGEPQHLPMLGRSLWARAGGSPLLAVGPSSVVDAVAQAMRPGAGPAASAIAPSQGPVFVLAGSLSPVTAGQVAAARSFDVVRLDPERLALDGDGYRAGAARDLAARLSAGRHVLACTAPADGRRSAVPARALAQAGGALLRDVLRSVHLGRVGIAGGDTSSLAVRALDAWALAYRGLIAPGVPLCVLRSDDPALDGVELMLKGGQMGGTDVFERLAGGAG